jgi:hypothetical protein
VKFERVSTEAWLPEKSAMVAPFVEDDRNYEVIVSRISAQVVVVTVTSDGVVAAVSDEGVVGRTTGQRVIEIRAHHVVRD